MKQLPRLLSTVESGSAEEQALQQAQKVLLAIKTEKLPTSN
jgi:hypothetical protein